MALVEGKVLGDMDSTCRNGSDRGLFCSTGEESGLAFHITRICWETDRHSSYRASRDRDPATTVRQSGLKYSCTQDLATPTASDCSDQAAITRGTSVDHGTKPSRLTLKAKSVEHHCETARFGLHIPRRSSRGLEKQNGWDELLKSRCFAGSCWAADKDR